MTLESWLASSRLARAAALPRRTASAIRHVASETVLASTWVVRSKEHHNYTYDITPRNLRHLAWWASAVTGASSNQCGAWITEALNDDALKHHVQAAVQRSDRRGLADLAVRIGRRAGWYAVVRALKPDHVVETGTDKGLGSVVIASALIRNGHGRLTTMDINPAAGYFISGKYAEVASLVLGDSVAALAACPPDVGIFIHDSDHTPEHERRELDSIAPALIARARILSDNAHAADSLLEWAEETGRRYLYFQELPDNHWYRGARIGAAW